MKRNGLLAVLFLVLFAALVAGCGGDDDDGGGAGGDGTELETREAGELRVGSDIPYPPFEFGRPPYRGFDVDIVNEVAERLDLEAEFVKTPFDTIFRDLAQEKFDLVASASTITAERRRQVDFSQPYFNADQSLMVKKGSGISSVADLRGKVVGAQLGTTGADYAKDEIEGTRTVRTYELADDAFNALQAGQIDGAVVDYPVTKYAERSKRDLEVVETIETGEKYGLALAKGSDELRRAVNEALTEIKEDGTYERIFRKWFREDPPASILR